MRKVLSLISFLLMKPGFSQDTAYFSTTFLKNKAASKAQGYLEKYFNGGDFGKYVKLNSRATVLYLHEPYRELKQDSIAEHWIQGFRVTFELQTPGYKTSFELRLLNNYEVIENTDYTGVNYTALFYRAHSDYLLLLNEDKILHPDTVRNYVVQSNPGKEWGQPEISRASFPPYRFHYRIFEGNCNPCSEIFIELDELKEIGREENEMIPVR